jgi:hypothetical protein
LCAQRRLCDEAGFGVDEGRFTALTRCRTRETVAAFVDSVDFAALRRPDQ